MSTPRLRTPRGRTPGVLGPWICTVVAAVCLLSGCATLTAPIQWTESSRYQPAQLSEFVVPRKIVTGDASPVDGYVLTVEEWFHLRAEFERLQGALEDCYGQGADDRAYATAVDGAKREALRICRQSKPRDVAFGAAIGFGLCGGIAGSVRALQP